MKAKSLKKNYILNLAQQILMLLTPLITAPYVSRVLGADGIGVFSFTSSVVAYFILFANLGINSFGQREISYYQDDIEKRSEVFWNTKILSFITSAVTLGFFLIFIFVSKTPNKAIYIILTLSFITSAADASWLFQGMEEFGILVSRNIICRILNIACIFLFVHKKSDLLIYVFALTVANTVCNISYWFFVSKFVKKPILKKIHPFSNIKTIFSLFIPTIAISVYTMLDKTMLGIFSDNSFENGYYEQATKITKMILVIITSLGTVMIPRIGHLFEKKDSEQIKNYMYRSYQFVWFLGIPLALGMIAVSKNFVPWFYGEGFEKTIPLLSILSLLFLAIGINNVTGVQYFIPTKRQNLFTRTVIIGSIVNLACNCLFIPKFLSIGAAIGSVIAESTIAIVQLIIIRKELSILKILKSSLKYLIAGILMFLVIYFENTFLEPSILSTFILIFTGTCVYFLVLYLIKDDFFIDNIRSIIKRIKQKIKGKTEHE